MNAERHEYLAKTIRSGRCVSSVQRPTMEWALREALCSSGDDVEVWRLRLVRHPVGGWWSERDRVRIETKGGVA